MIRGARNMPKTGVLNISKHGGVHEIVVKLENNIHNTSPASQNLYTSHPKQNEPHSALSCSETHPLVSLFTHDISSESVVGSVCCDENETETYQKDSNTAFSKSSTVAPSEDSSFVMQDVGINHPFNNNDTSTCMSKGINNHFWLKSSDMQVEQSTTLSELPSTQLPVSLQGHTIRILEQTDDSSTSYILEGKDSRSILDSAFFTVIDSNADMSSAAFSTTLVDSSHADGSTKPMTQLKSNKMPTKVVSDSAYSLLAPSSQFPNSNNRNYLIADSLGSCDIVDNLLHSDSFDDSPVSSVNATPVSGNVIIDQSSGNLLLTSSRDCTLKQEFDHFSSSNPAFHASEFTVEKNEAYEESQQIYSSIAESSLPSLHVPTNSSAVTSLAHFEHNSELNLNSLPNFLGLESSASSQSINSLLDVQSVNLLESYEPTALDNPSLLEQPLIRSEFPQSHVDGDQNVSITTISISNDDKKATKIMVNTDHGQPQMYVINAADLDTSQLSHSGLLQGHQMYVINTSSRNSSGSQIKAEEDVMRGELVSESGQLFTDADSSTNDDSREKSSTETGVSEIPGFILLPVVDNANIERKLKKSLKLPKRPIKCSVPGCMKAFKKLSKLKVHQMLHTGERPYKCNLLGCDWAFTTAHKLKRHMDSHEGRKDYVCEHPGCGHKFTTIYNLNTHRKLHERPCTEICPEDSCGKSFPTRRQLDLHLRNIHNYEDRSFICPHPGCEKAFFSQSTMGSHMRVHQLKEEDLRCSFPGCGKEFTKLCRLRQHERLHSGEKPFVCDFEGCNWAFTTASKLKRHQTKHTGLRRWVCEICQKSFQRSEHLKGHLITHSGNRPFICPVEGCRNTFTAKSSWYVHLKKHDDSGKTIVYHCPMEKCDKHYQSKASLRQHILRQHCQNVQASPSNQGMVHWLNLLEPGDNTDVSLPQEGFTHVEGIDQSANNSNSIPILPADFLTESMAGQARLPAGTDALTDQVIITQMMVAAPSTADQVASSDVVHPDRSQSQFHPQHQSQLVHDPQLQQQMFEADSIIQQHKLSIEAIERGKKSLIVLENKHGSARTDPRSNAIISEMSLKRWQKQKEIEAAKLGAQLNALHSNSQQRDVMVNIASDYKHAVSNNVPLAGQPVFTTSVLVSKPSAGGKDTKVKVEIPDMELQAEGISEDALDGRSSSLSDAFISELFVRDPETGLTYRQTQLLQDDPPNPCILEDMEGVTPTHNLVLDSALEAQFEDGTLHFQDLD